MDLGGPQCLSKILTPEEIKLTPPVVQDKLKTYLERLIDDFCKEKAAANRLGEYEQKTEDLQVQIQEYELKLHKCQQSVDELRQQLDSVSSERNNLLELANNNEKELHALRIERNVVVDERDSLHKLLERKNYELERLDEEVRSVQQQLKSATSAKCEAIARLDEIESKEAALDFKERRMEQERSMLLNQIQTLSSDLSRNMNELQNIRRDNTLQGMHLEAKLTEKVEELKISQAQSAQYKETIDKLTENIQELSSKLLSTNEDTHKMMDHYKKELEAKTKLAELYKNNADDTILERSELSAAIADLKRMLVVASDKYGELETKLKATELKHEQDLEDKDKEIENLKTEIRHANDLLKELQHESMDSAISKMAPSAAVASRLIRTDMSLTELYSLYVKTTDELEMRKRENARINLQLKTILHELSESAPMIKKQELEYEKLLETNTILVQQRDELLSKKADMNDLMENAHSKINQMDRENKKLKHSQTDLSRQVCYLLKEVSELRIGLSTDHSNNDISSGNLSTAEDIISKKLVTFSSIPELQENNQKLLLLVRDLSSKLEEADALKQQLEESSYLEKIETYSKKVQNMQETLNQQNNTVATLLSKCERYKKMYFDTQKQLKMNVNDNVSDDDQEMMPEEDNENSKEQSSLSASNGGRKSINEPQIEKKIRELEQQLQDSKDHYKSLKEHYEYYAQEKKNNDQILNDQLNSMRTEMRELTSTNCKLMSSVEYTKEQIKLQQKNITTYKQQISALEDRSKNYETTIIKHEQTIHYLKDEIMKSQHAASSAESEVSHLRHENRVLKDTASRLQSEKEGFRRESQQQNLLLNNIEMIKSNLERSEMEGRARLEQRLDDTVRELSAQRRRFQEEEDRFRELTNELKRQTETAQQRMEDEKSQADKLRADLIAIREELSMKSVQIDELSKKLQESLAPSKNDNPIVLANKKAREMEIKLEEAYIEITSLSSQLDKARDHSEQYYKMSQNAESEIKTLHEMHTKKEEELAQLKKNEFNLTSRISELEAEVQLASISEEASSNINQSEQLKKTKEELKSTLEKLSECNRNIRALRSENNELAEALNVVENKYANEMILHSADIQELSKVKTDLSKVQEQIDELTFDTETAKNAYTDFKQSHEESIRLLHTEKEELEKRVDDLNCLNSKLHDQMEAVTNKLSALSQLQHNISANDSLMETSAADLNRSNLDEDNKNNDQLLQIIKFLRKEKDLTIARLDILKAENTRLMSEHTILQKKIDELNGFLNQERAKSETSVVSASKHEEILRKIETLNAITDSNRILREERNALTIRVKELTDRISTVEDELFPLQNLNRDNAMKIEELTSENTSLRTEAIKWRQRANVLVEKSNKNPEEFRRLQMERENLAKMLTNEKEVLKQISEELKTIKSEKSRLESELVTSERAMHIMGEEKKKLSDDYNNLKQSHTLMLKTLSELKLNLSQQEERVEKMSGEIQSKDALILESKNKEIQIRKIAKRYKDSYLELTSKTAGEGGTSTQENTELNANAGGDATAAANAELEQLRQTIETLNAELRSIQEEYEKLRKDYDNLKSTVEFDEQSKVLLRDAKSRLVREVEAKNNVLNELNATKAKLENHDALKLQYEELLQRMEKEIHDNKEVVNRLTRENENLLMRINQLNRQLGLQQSSKPSTSSVATDKSCISDSSPRTANVKPMSGSATPQQSATVTPWRGGETPLASIRPISVQNSRTATILPSSQQIGAGGSSTSTSSTSSSNTTSSNTPSSASCSNKALVPPQQQVHTTGSVVESMASSPTSSHTDYMPSTSSVAIQQPQQTNESQLMVSGGQHQAVALVSPRVEASSQNVPSPNLQQLQQDSNNQQPSTSGTTSSSSHIAVSSHNRHTPSSSNVTTTQAGSSGGHKRPREQLEGDSSTSAEEGNAADKAPKLSKRMRTPMHAGEASDSGQDVEYQVPTSSQREDDIVVVDSEEDDAMAEAEHDEGDAEENEGYADSYDQDQDMDENEGQEMLESNMQGDVEADNNEVDVDECIESNVLCTSGGGVDGSLDNQTDNVGASTSQAAADAGQQPDNHQQIQAIGSSGSCETTAAKQQATTSTLSRQQKAALIIIQQAEAGDQDPSGSRPTESSTEVERTQHLNEVDANKEDEEEEDDEEDMDEDGNDESEVITGDDDKADAGVEDSEDADEDYAEDGTAMEPTENIDSESHLSGTATQSEIQDVQPGQAEATSEENEGTDGVSSEGEKQAVEEIEEEGREAEATTSPSINTRSKATRGAASSRRASRNFNRGGRPTPIVWQESPGNSRNPSSPHHQQQQQQRGQEPPGSPMRGFPNQRSQRARRMRRPTGGNYNNMRYS